MASTAANDIAVVRSASANARLQPELESRWETYSNIIRAAPWYHQLFIFLVLLQALYVIAERVAVIARSTPTSSDEIFFFGVIITSVLFAAWYGIHAILSINYMEMGAFRVVTLWLLARTCIEWAAQQDECASAAAMCLSFFVIGLAFNAATLVLTIWMLPDLKWCVSALSVANTIVQLNSSAGNASQILCHQKLLFRIQVAIQSHRCRCCHP